MPGPLHRRRFVALVILISVLVEALRWVWAILFQRFVYLPAVQLQPTSSGLQLLQFETALTSFLISPLLLLVLYFVLVKREGLGVPLELTTVLTFFLGGIVGFFAGLLAGDLLYFPIDGLSVLNTVSSQFLSAISVSFLTLDSLEEGLTSVFVGVTAVVVANRLIRRGERTEAPAEESGPLQGESQEISG